MSSGEPEYLIPRETAQTVILADPDPHWPDVYAGEETRIRAALGEPLVELHHVGSTAVPGLAAKPVIDVVLLVTNSADEDSYAPALQVAGYQFHLREPHWHEHRLFKRGTPHFTTPDHRTGEQTKVNLHVFTTGSVEAHRMLAFRDWLRDHPGDRDLYERTKRTLAGRRWEYVQDYADAKAAVVEEIMGRALGSESSQPSD